MTSCRPPAPVDLAGDRDRGDHPRAVDLLAELGELADQRVALDPGLAEHRLGRPPGDPPGVAEPDGLGRQDRGELGDEDLAGDHLELVLGQRPALGQAQDQRGARPTWGGSGRQALRAAGGPSSATGPRAGPGTARTSGPSRRRRPAPLSSAGPLDEDRLPGRLRSAGGPLRACRPSRGPTSTIPTRYGPISPGRPARPRGCTARRTGSGWSGRPASGVFAGVEAAGSSPRGRAGLGPARRAGGRQDEAIGQQGRISGSGSRSAGTGMAIRWRDRLLDRAVRDRSARLGAGRYFHSSDPIRRRSWSANWACWARPRVKVAMSWSPSGPAIR